MPLAPRTAVAAAACSSAPMTLLLLAVQAQALSGRVALRATQGCNHPTSRTQPVLWIHLHKFGGTSICDLAEQQEKLIQPSAYCEWQPYDSPGGNHYPISCEDRKAEFARQGATWGSIEHAITPGSLCFSDFNYGIMLRDPNEAAVSEANFEQSRGTPQDVPGSIHCVQEGTCQRGVTWGSNLWMYFDNFVVRNMAGPEAWWAPPGAITEELTLKAIETISKMQVILFINEIDTVQPPALCQAFGWQQASTHSRPSEHSLVLNSTEARLAALSNRHDYAVYAHFRQIPFESRVLEISRPGGWRQIHAAACKPKDSALHEHAACTGSCVATSELCGVCHIR